MTFHLEKVTLADVIELQKISRQTFCETFAESNSEENMAIYLKKNLSLIQLSTELKNPDSFFYFALLDQKVIGFLKLNTGLTQTEPADKTAVEIERIYVLKEFHGKHVGQLLDDKALQTAKDMEAPNIWLDVWEQNPRAIRFYQKNGFTDFDKHIFILRSDEQVDIVMKKDIMA